MDSDSFAKCAYCTGTLARDAGPSCKSCGVMHHYDCWMEFGGCTTFGCHESPDMKIARTIR
jgi:hypothetical protein